MFVGVLRFSLEIVGARSLKDKRSVVRSLKDRVQSRLRVSIAEVGAGRASGSAATLLIDDGSCVSTGV